ncbi:hypothetical protein M408DRAFT_270129 [Serendipita vermifera MAFF 305830]|uniref:Uncharacterized protein n=1 Tax=Serendipita vermifera MAFF 305830 TaxID=933852 RepID=A0A0C3BH33_SERVB|nr:hypothetical protein M408DRAFT_270129 [Serendipita vermifera MAFF 305830]
MEPRFFAFGAFSTLCPSVIGRWELEKYMHQDSHESITRDLREKDPGPRTVSSLEDDALLLHSLKGQL